MALATPCHDGILHICYIPQAIFLVCSEVQDSDLQFAADLAAWYSKKQGEGKCPVIMASPTDIKKPKGAAPGQVMVKKEATILGKPDNSVPAQQECL